MYWSRIAYTLAEAVIMAVQRLPELSQLHPDALKDLLFQLPDLTQEDWMALHDTVDGERSTESVVALHVSLQNMLSMDEGVVEACYAFCRLVCVDGVAYATEDQVCDLVGQLATGDFNEAIDELGRLISGPLAAISEKMADTESGYAELSRAIKKRIHGWRFADLNLALSDHDMIKLSLAGILVARVAKADGRIDEMELVTSCDYLSHQWNISHEEARFVFRVSVLDDLEGVDTLRICRWLYELTTHCERVRFVELLFRVALVDNDLSNREVDELLNISANLRIEQEDFHAALMRNGGEVATP